MEKKMVVACEVKYWNSDDADIVLTRENLEKNYRLTPVPLDGKWKIYKPDVVGSLEGLNILATVEGRSSISLKMITVEAPEVIPNWQPEHFPVGSVVVMRDYARDKDEGFVRQEGGNAEITVARIRKNGPTSHLVDTGEYNVRTEMNQCFHFDHITSIKSRGDGPVKIVHWRDTSKMINLKSEITYDLLNKRRYYAVSVRELLAFLIHRNSSFPKGMQLRNDFVELFMQQTFVKTHMFSGGGWYISADKKKTRRWIQQNINRLVMPMKEVRRIDKEAKEQEYADYCRELDHEFSRDFLDL